MMIQFLLVDLYGNQIFEIKRVSAFILEKKLALSTLTTKKAKSSDTPPTVDKKRSKAVTRSKKRSSSTNPTTDRTLSKIPSTTHQSGEFRKNQALLKGSIYPIFPFLWKTQNEIITAVGYPKGR